MCQPGEESQGPLPDAAGGEESSEILESDDIPDAGSHRSETDLSELQSLLQEIFSYNSLVHAFSGATGSVVALSTFYPLDVVRTRLQVDDKRKAKGTIRVITEIFQEEGFSSLYRGLLPVLQSLYCSNFVYFYTYHGIKAGLKSKGIKSNSVTDLVLGYLSGVINALITTPLWVVNTRLKLQGAKLKDQTTNTGRVKFNGLIDGLVKVAKDEGIFALWNGVQASFLLAGNPAIHFMVYEGIKRFLLRSAVAPYEAGKKLSSFQLFLIGGIAKSVATVLTYPMQLAQCKLRASSGKENSNKMSVLTMLLKIFREYGFVGLFRGMEAKLLQTVLTAALMFATYEKLASFIFTIMRVKEKKKLH